MHTNQHFVVGIYSDQDDLLHGVEDIRKAGVKIDEVYTPYPIHGLENKLGYPESFMGVAAFLFGALGATLAMIMQVSMIGIDWPMIIGGKPFIALPDFIPIFFESTVLIGAFGMVGTFFVTCDLKPHKVPRIFDRRATDDKLVVTVDLADNKMTEEEIVAVLKEAGVEEHYRKDFETDKDGGPFIPYVRDLFKNGVTSSSRPLHNQTTGNENEVAYK